jgi:hypothetical protein
MTDSSFPAWLAAQAAGLTRRLVEVDCGERLLDLAGHDYLGLARDPRVVAGRSRRRRRTARGRVPPGWCQGHRRSTPNLSRRWPCSAARVAPAIYLLARLVSSGVASADEPLLEASIEMAGKLALGRQSGHGVNTGISVRRQVARFAGPPPGLPDARLGDRSAESLRCLAGRDAITDAMDAG